MSRPFGTTFGDLVGKLDVNALTAALRSLPTPPTHRKPRAELTGDCPRKRSASISDQWHARCPDLPKVVYIATMRAETTPAAPHRKPSPAKIGHSPPPPKAENIARLEHPQEIAPHGARVAVDRSTAEAV
jgi:hypothetical protein